MSTKIPLTPINDAYGGYLATVKVGEDTQDMPIDLLNADIWIKCGVLPHLNTPCSTSWACSPGTSYKKQDGHLFCSSVATQDVSIGDVQVTNGVVNVLQHASYQDTPPESRLGLAPTDDNDQTAALFKKVNSLSLSLAANDPFLLFDGVDQSLIDKEGLKGYTVPTFDSLGWYMSLSAVKFGDSAAQMPCQLQDYYSCVGAFVSRYEYVSMDAELYADFKTNHLSSANCDYTSSERTVCDASANFPRITIASGSKAFYLDAADYTRPSTVPGKVDMLIEEAKANNVWGLGLPFLKKYYTHFDHAKNEMTLYCHENKTCDTDVLPVLDAPPTYSDTTSSDLWGGYGNDYSTYTLPPFTPSYPSDSDTDYNTGGGASVGIVYTSHRSGRQTGVYIGVGTGFSVLFMVIGFLKFVSKSTTPEEAKPEESAPIEGESSQTAYSSVSTPKAVAPQPQASAV
ncbi:hypothetical protein Poli38472_011780 [Pythium oligandrum]|uniref:Peptidase A1 domain-containing protein n=1 Tax=Pythium oligandrum TaxID=41045 RepID=A0A8K1C7W2_PYTOL|nr:hypothetical protein Poli38472_011780 [Pythium oligandrum]|eukprot:TMW58192.1 hypothetical protein Poli38472_011780 [Pythium oligandrum]